MTLSILVVEDHALVASGLALGLEAEGHEVQVSDGSDLPDLLDGDAWPDVVLLDLNLGQLGSGIDLIPLFGSAKVVVLTGETDTARLADAYDGGADAVLDKSIPFTRLLRQIEAIARGNTTDADQRRHEIVGRRRTEQAERTRRLAPFEELTGREQEVLRMLIDGHQAAEIAELSFVSISTVRSQIRSVLAKLGVNSQLSAVASAKRAGWPPDQC